MRVLGLIAIFGLVGCVSSGGGLSKSTLSTMPITSTMPTGSAAYAGKIESNAAAGANTARTTADWTMAANFDAKTVNATVFNLAEYSVFGGVTTDITTTGNLTGNGTISGSKITIPKVSGVLTVASVSVNGVPAAAGATINYATTAPLTANFVGTNAEGVYGTGPVSGGSYEIYGSKQ